MHKNSEGNCSEPAPFEATSPTALTNLIPMQGATE